MDITFNILKLIKINIYSANNQSIQLNANGWKQIYSNNGVIVKVNNLLRIAQVSLNLQKNISAKTVTTILAEGSIPSGYRPITNIHQNNRQDDELWLTSAGGIFYYCNVALSNANIRAVMLYNY